MSNTNTQKSNVDIKRERFLWTAIIPQIIMLTISTLWICFFPDDNVIKYFKFNFQIAFYGIGLGLGLAAAGYLFYLFAKKTKIFFETVELFENMLSPVFKNFKLIDLVVLSFISGFSEEVFFRGLLFPKTGLILSSLAFGILHFPGKRFWIYFVWATTCGGLFALILKTTGTIVIPMLAHMINNLIGMLLLKRLASYSS